MRFLGNDILFCNLWVRFLHSLEFIKLLMNLIHVESLRLNRIVHVYLIHIWFLHESRLFAQGIIFVAPIFIIGQSVRYQLLSFCLCALFWFEFATGAASTDELVVWDRTGFDDIGHASFGRLLDHTMPQLWCFITWNYLLLDAQRIARNVGADCQIGLIFTDHLDLCSLRGNGRQIIILLDFAVLGRKWWLIIIF